MAWVWPAPRPPIWPVMCTPSPIGVIDSLPLTRLPDAEARFTVAELAVLVPCEAGAGDDIGGAAFSPVVEHAASAQAAARASSWWRRCMDMADSLRSEEHTSELQSLMRISYAVFGLKKKNQITFSIVPQ